MPTNIRWSSGLTKNQADYSLFAVPVARGDDAFISPTLSLTHLWRNSAGLTWQPLGMLALTGDLSSTRDLRVYPDSTSLGRLAYEERRFLAGVPVGVERDRLLTTAIAITPRLSSWLRPRFTTSSNFVLSRTLTSRDAGSRAGRQLVPSSCLKRSTTAGVGKSACRSTCPRALRRIWADSSGVGKFVARVRPVDFSSRLGRSSTYDLTAFDPGLGFMLGLGGRDRFLTHEGETREGRRRRCGHDGVFRGGAAAGDQRHHLLLAHQDRPIPAAGGGAFTETVNPAARVAGGQSPVDQDLRRRTADTGGRWRRDPASKRNFVPAERRGHAWLLAPSPRTPLRRTFSSSFRNGLALTFGMATRSQRTENNGNATELDQDDLTGSLNYSFALPAAISRVRKRVRSNLTALSSKTLTCLEQGGDPECIVVSDLRRQEIRGGLDTDLLKTVSGGLQFGYSISDARHVSRRTSQIFLLLTFQLSLYAGDYR